MEVAEGVRSAVHRSAAPISITELASILAKDIGVTSRNVKAAVAAGYVEN